MFFLNFILIFVLSVNAAYADGIEAHYKKIRHKTGSSYFKNIDQIYLINLDQRPEKLEHCKRELSPYGIYPQRFPAVYGWALSTQTLNEIGLTFLPWMWRGRESVFYFPPDGAGRCDFVNLDESCVGKNFFSIWTSRGAIGCTLSHLSVLQDAYNSGYETIWVMEDDISVRDNPHKLSDLIGKLDQLVGREGWDILYTDYDAFINVDQSRDLLKQLPMMWRPDMPSFDLKGLLEHREVGEDFVKIGSRHRAHSLILRRSGIEKILNFYKTHGIFTPYDHEMSLVPGIRFYVLKYQIVTSKELCSDTKHKFFN
ncbi:MAG: glycosyltransferase family 25 protein [Chlamydiales bacterium]|nr:glycosyltransferase family 25 protein [Chlamydiales bacterium]